MSYVLDFIPKDESQSWEEALESAEEVEDYGPPFDSQAWRAITAAADELFPGVKDLSDANENQLEHEASGMQLTAAVRQAGIGVPYWHRGAMAVDVIGAIYRLGMVLESETGLRGYDPQVGAPVQVDRVQLAIDVYTRGVDVAHDTQA